MVDDVVNAKSCAARVSMLRGDGSLYVEGVQDFQVKLEMRQDYGEALE